MREHPIAPKPTRIRLPAVEDSHRVVRPIELEQRLDVVGSPPTPARLAPPEPRGRPLGLVEPRRGRVRGAALTRDTARAGPGGRRPPRSPDDSTGHRSRTGR